MKDEYDKEPVFYCKRCLSLNIKGYDDELLYCDECGSTDIDTALIHDWMKLYKDRYNEYYIDKDTKKNK